MGCSRGVPFRAVPGVFRGCSGVFRGCSGGVPGCSGVFRGVPGFTDTHKKAFSSNKLRSKEMKTSF